MGLLSMIALLFGSAAATGGQLANEKVGFNQADKIFNSYGFNKARQDELDMQARGFTEDDRRLFRNAIAQTDLKPENYEFEKACLDNYYRNWYIHEIALAEGWTFMWYFGCGLGKIGRGIADPFDDPRYINALKGKPWKNWFK